MSVAICKACNKEVGRRDSICEACGAKVKSYGTPVILIILVVVALATLLVKTTMMPTETEAPVEVPPKSIELEVSQQSAIDTLQKRPATGAEIKVMKQEAQQAVTAKLFESQSVTFEPMEFHESKTHSSVVCGHYSGVDNEGVEFNNLRFISNGKTTILETAERNIDGQWGNFCTN